MVQCCAAYEEKTQADWDNGGGRGKIITVLLKVECMGPDQWIYSSYLNVNN